jgi:hypothetical protein
MAITSGRLPTEPLDELELLELEDELLEELELEDDELELDELDDDELELLTPEDELADELPAPEDELDELLPGGGPLLTPPQAARTSEINVAVATRGK